MEWFKKFIAFIVSEIRQGNMLVIGLIIVAYFYIAIPIYAQFLKVIDKSSLNTAIATEVAIDIHKLREEMAELKTKVNADFNKRRAGHVGSTNF